jgi:SecD/SecF fusion protein
MNERPIWKPILIVAVILLLSLTLANNGLKKGIDLAGGFVLVYEVDVPEGENAAQAIEQIREVLSKRVDPNGVRNLTWRQQGANRLEIQAALAPPEVRQLREKLIQAHEALEAGNVTQSQLEAMLKQSPAAVQKSVTRMAAGNAERTDLLNALITASKSREQARKPYIEAWNAANKAEKTADDLPEGETDAQKKQKEEATAHAKKLRAESTAKVKEFNDAKKAYSVAIQRVLATNVNPGNLERVLTLAKDANTNELGETTHPRADALKKLKETHADRADQIQIVVDTHDQYNAVRGPLDDPEDLIALLRGSGVLEFRIAPGPSGDVNSFRARLHEKGPKAGMDDIYRWYEIDSVEAFANTAEEKQFLEASAPTFFAGRGIAGEQYGGKYYILLSNQPGQKISPSESGWKLKRAGRTIDSRTGFPAVSFELNSHGGKLLGAMTEANTGQLMTIVLDGKAMSTATIQSRISTSGQISSGSGYSKQELDYLIRTLNAGSLKAQLSERPISIKFFNPEMGNDNLAAGYKAAVGAVIAVAIFMAIYYLFSGMVANFALAANMILILGVMSTLQAVFTLPGIAGMVLTIGMAVDANVLIFERIREELDIGADVKTAVRIGYSKALGTIVDANITTLITCLVLGYFATVEVKGFAITLGIGICASMFTALFCTRVIFNYYVAWFNPSTIKMLPNVFPKFGKMLHPNINWVGKRKVIAVASCLMVVASLLVVASRGKDMLAIEFRAGTQVGFKLKEGKNLARQDAVDRLDKIAAEYREADPDGKHNWLDSSTASIVAVGDEENEFSIALLNENNEQVSEAITKAFEDVLEKKRPVHFAGNPNLAAKEQPALPGYIYKITRNTLIDNLIGVSETAKSQYADTALDTQVAEFFGGVAVVLSDLEPAASVEDITARVRAMRNQPRWENLGNRNFKVIGLQPAAANGNAGSSDTPLFSAIAVVSTDNSTNYDDNDSQFRDQTGLAYTEWQLISSALLSEEAFDSVQNFSSQVSGTMQRQAIVAMFLSLLAVVAYIWLRFGSLRYGFAAIVALAHDVTIALGLVALSHYIYSAMGGFLGVVDFKIDLALVAALLTIVGYSLNDTIVVFDRIRENRGRLAEASADTINNSINQTISRTLLTSGTTFLAVLTLYFFGGTGVHGFAFAMIIGVMVGTYSSVGVAANLLLLGKGNKGGQAQASDENIDAEQTVTA